ncbi:MAG: hypothetical protein QF451_16970 [Nitrospinota bacterium]|nr:hypothetical protein [Nitrospinota bacterium]
MANTTVEAINKLMDKPGAIESFFQLTVHDYYTYTHSVHVYIYSSMLTREIIGDENEALLKELGVGFLLHDIGKKRYLSRDTQQKRKVGRRRMGGNQKTPGYRL